VQAELIRLRALLAADDLEAVQLYRQMRPSLAGLLGVSADRFGRLVEEYSLDEALQLLDTLTGTAGESP